MLKFVTNVSTFSLLFLLTSCGDAKQPERTSPVTVTDSTCTQQGKVLVGGQCAASPCNSATQVWNSSSQSCQANGNATADDTKTVVSTTNAAQTSCTNRRANWLSATSTCQETTESCAASGQKLNTQNPSLYSCSSGEQDGFLGVLTQILPQLLPILIDKIKS